MPTFAELKAKAAGAASTGKEKFTNVRDRNTSVPMKQTNWDPYSGEVPPPPPPPRSLVNNNTKPKPLAPLPPPPSRTSSAALSAASTSRASSSSPSPAPPLPGRPGSSGPPPPPPRGAKTGVPPAPPPRSNTGLQSRSTPAPPPVPSGGPPSIVRSSRPGGNARAIAPVVPPETPALDWTNLSPEDKQVFFSWLDEFFANFTPPQSVKPNYEEPVGNDSPQSHGPPPLRVATKPSSWSQR